MTPSLKSDWTLLLLTRLHCRAVRLGTNFILSDLVVFLPAAKASSSREVSKSAPDFRGSQSLTSTFWLKAFPVIASGTPTTVAPSVTLRIWAVSDEPSA